MLKYNDIIDEFKEVFKDKVNEIKDIRPCDELFGVPSIDNAIIIWFKDGTKVVYIAKERNYDGT